MLKSSLCDYSNKYILVNGTNTITGNAGRPGGRTAAQTQTVRENSEGNRGVILKKFSPFSDCISEINNTQIDNAKDIDVVMLMYILIEYNNNYSNTAGSL